MPRPEKGALRIQLWCIQGAATLGQGRARGHTWNRGAAGRLKQRLAGSPEQGLHPVPRPPSGRSGPVQPGTRREASAEEARGRPQQRSSVCRAESGGLGAETQELRTGSTSPPE